MLDASWIDTLRLQWRQHLLGEGSPALSRPGMFFVELEQAHVRCRVVGKAQANVPTAVLICDPPGVIEHYDEVLQLLATHARVVCIEPPGFGFSLPKRGFNFSFQQYWAALRELLAALDMGPYMLAFPCIWAHLALQLAAENPQGITRLLLVQAPAWACQNRWAHYIDQPRFLTRPVVGQAVMALAPFRIGRLWYRVSLQKGYYQQLLPTLGHALGQGGFCCLASLWQAWFGAGAEEPKPVAVHQPSLVAWGLADRTHANSQKQSLQASLCNVQWYDFAQAGHCPELEAPQEYAQLFARWVAAGRADGGNVGIHADIHAGIG